MGAGRCAPTPRRSVRATTRRSSCPTLDEAEALRLASAELEAGGYDLETLADIVIADRSATVTEALELAADAMICANGYRPTRARLVIPPDPAALRAAAGRR